MSSPADGIEGLSPPSAGTVARPIRKTVDRLGIRNDMFLETWFSTLVLIAHNIELSPPKFNFSLEFLKW